MKQHWQQEAEEFIFQGNYTEAASLYEQAIEAESEVKSNYWYLGLILLLQGREEEAQTTWLLGMMDCDSEELEDCTDALVEVLATEATRQQNIKNHSLAWLLRGHIREIAPFNINNLLTLIQVAGEIKRLSGEELKNWQAIALLHNQPPGSVNTDILLSALKQVFNCIPLHPSSVEFAALCLPHLYQEREFSKVIRETVVNVAYHWGNPAIASQLLELYLRINDKNLDILRYLANFYQDSHQYSLGIAIGKWCYSLEVETARKITANYWVMRGLISAGGYWDEAKKLLGRHKELLFKLIEDPPKQIDRPTVTGLINSCFFLPYYEDRPALNRPIQNKILSLYQFYSQQAIARSSKYKHKNIDQYTKNTEGELQRSRKMKIGYISHCLSSHSVGWLARWLFEYNNRDIFQVYLYFVSYRNREDPLRDWYESQADRSYRMASDSVEIADRIFKDNIDVLVDLDSITLDVTCEVMALQPAPIQVTWLGWDASGLPGIDYFIADPCVLPEHAQEYYREKIWRLPQTYIAVDGFEVGVPTLRRDRLNIPKDAVVYFSGQKGYKRHPDTVRLQMKILEKVPNSYFLIKGVGDEQAIQRFFIQLAEEEGVDANRLRFLQRCPSEAIHRANLGIADVVLDTYPYNGATTTMETLWMGIPMVTRVGEQFAARNSYTMMINAGITEGIAWTDEEYVEWGIRLGQDEQLRQDISWRLRQGRQTAPLWNAKQFTLEMEKAYQQMWQIYLQNNAG